MKTHRVIIIGAGFGGLRTALELERRCARTEACEILLIDRDTAHLYTPLLYEVATGDIEAARKACAGNLRAGVCVSYDSYMAILGSKRIKFRRAEVTGFDLEAKCIRIDGKASIAYDDLVIALGSETATYNIPGVERHAIPLKTIQDALRVRDRLHRLVAECARGERDSIRVFVGGAGATGTEFSGELANFFRILESAKVLRPEIASVTLVEAAPTVLGMLPASMQEQAKARLTKLGVDIQLQTAVERVTEKGITLKSSDPKTTEKGVATAADLFVWTGGVKPASLLGALPVEKDKKGRLVVEPTGRVKGQTHVYAVGDCAGYVSPETGVPVPALAQSAIEEAKLVARNIARACDGLEILAYHPPARWDTIVPIGGKFALADIGALRLTGMIAYVVRKGADLRYFLSILPPIEAFKVWVSGARLYIKND